MGHGESCCNGYLCDTCRRELESIKHNKKYEEKIHVLRSALELISQECDACAKNKINYNWSIDETAKSALNSLK